MTEQRMKMTFLLMFLVITDPMRLSEAHIVDPGSGLSTPSLTFSIARGTQHLLPVDIFQGQTLSNVSDQDVLFIVHGECDICTLQRQPAGHIELFQNHVAYKHFSLHELKQGHVAFQHYYSAGLGLVVFNLKVRINGLDDQFLTVYAQPYEGHIILTSEAVLVLIEEGTAYVQTQQLNATTNFDNENATLTYKMLSQPQLGVLEVNEGSWTNSKEQWVSIYGRSSQDLQNTFTQSEVKQGRIRYRQTVTLSPPPPELTYINDSFQFQLFSYQLPGPLDTFSLLIIPRVSMVKPKIVYNVTSVVVKEGSNVQINNNSLSVSFSPSKFQLNQWHHLITTQEVRLEVVIIKSPKHGALRISNASLLTDKITFFEFAMNGLNYTHDNSETLKDEIVFRLVAQSVSNLPVQIPDSTPDIVLPIEIIPVNDNLPVLNQLNLISPIEGSFIFINTSMIYVSDQDLPEVDFEVIVQNNSDVGGHFANISNLDEQMEHFRMSHLKHGEVVYTFLQLGKDLHYNHSIIISDGVHFVTEVLQISVIPLSISVRVIYPENSSCVITIDTADSSFMFISKTLFHIDLDQSERLSEVVVEVIEPPLFGAISYKEHGKPLQLFSYSDIMDYYIVYTLKDMYLREEKDSLKLQFSIGHGQSAVVSFPVCIAPLPYPMLKEKTAITVPLKGEVVITNHSLHSIQTRYLSGAPELIHYHIVHHPQYGLLVNLSSDNSATSLASFTQADVDNQRIAYLNHKQVDMTNSKLPVDNFKFNISNQHYQLDEVKTLEVIFKVLNLTVVNTGLTVTEGSSSAIEPSQLYAVAPKHYRTKIYILEQPKHGVLILTRLPLPQIPQPTIFELDDIFFGYVSYNHSGQESPMDNFRFLIHADFNKTNYHDDQIYSGLFNISVNLVNNNPPIREIRETFVVVEGGEKAITTEDLRFRDPDSNFDPEDLKYIMNWKLYGGMICLRNNCTTQAPFEWYQRDMHGDLVYKHDKDGGSSDFILFTVSDGELFSTSEVLFINIQETIAERIANASVVVVENENATLSSANMNYTVNGTPASPSEYVYIVSRLPSFGVLLNSSTSSPIQIFTQADINSGIIMYNHRGENSVEDSFLFTINVKRYVDTNNLVKIVITPVDDDIPVLTVNKPLFVNQGSLAHINKSLLAITDTDTVDRTKLMYLLSKGPFHGLLKKLSSTSLTDYKKVQMSFTQDDIDHSKIRYEHIQLHDQNGDVWLDSLSFQISDFTTISPVNYTIDIVIVPKAVVPVTTHGLIVDEGGLALIDASSIIITHPYFAKTDGKVSIYGPITAGHLVVNGQNCTEPKCAFQLSDIKKGYVHYRHDDTETTQGGFQFVIHWDNHLPDSGLIQYNITILPVNDERPMIFNNTKLCLYAGQTVTLNSQHLLTIDKDTPPEKLFYHFYITPSQKLHGHFSVNNTQQDTFSQADINAGLVQFVDQHSFDGHPLQLSFNVSDGKFNSSGIFVVVATVVDLLVNIVPITVSMGGSVVIDHSVVHALTNIEEILDSSIFYYIDQNDGQKYGQIVDSANPERNLKEIRQSYISLKNVMYVHKAIDIWESFDYVNMTVFHPLALKNRSVSLEVNILLLDDPTSVFAVKKQLHVNEGGKTCLNQSMLDARNIRYFTWKNFTDQYSLYDLFLTFNVTNQSQYGRLLNNSNNGSPVLSFSHNDLVAGHICYQNDGSENNSDKFSVNVFILNEKGILLNRTSSSTVYINISLLNDEKPVLAVLEPLNKTFVQGFPDIVSSTDLRIVDEDNPPQDLEYTVVTPPQFGKLKLGDDEANRFTQVDVDKGKLLYLPDLVGSTKFQFEFSDHLHPSKTYWFYITIEKVSLTLTTLQSLEYTQTRSTVIITKHTLDTKTNGNRNETVFTVTKAPQNGQIVVLNEVRTSFTQSEVDANLVLYKQINKTEYRDNVTLFGTNSQARTSEFTLAIKVLMQGKVNDDITLHPFLTQPLPSELIDLTEVRTMSTGRPPRIQITSTFQYGYISYRYPNRDVSSIPISSFDYDDLHNHLVYFTWIRNPSLKLDQNYTENVTGVVWVDGISPGEFSLSLILQPPSELTRSSTKLDASATPTNPGENPHNANGNRDGFQYAFYVPLIGLIMVIVVLVLVVIIFCCSQSRRIKFNLKGFVPASSPEHKLSVEQSHPPYSEDIGQEYSDSESSSAADIMMVQNAQQQMHSGAPLMAVSASHTHVPHNQLSQDHGSSSGYHTHTTVAVTPFSDESNYTTSPAQHRHLDSPVGTSFHPSPLHFGRGIEIRSNSPVRRINPNRRNIPQYSSMTRVSLDRSSPVKNFREYSASTALQFSRSQIRDSSSSLGYDSSSLTQESSRQSRPPSALTPVAMDKTVVKQDEPDISSLYRTTHPVLKAPQYWV